MYRIATTGLTSSEWGTLKNGLACSTETNASVVTSMLAMVPPLEQIVRTRKPNQTKVTKEEIVEPSSNTFN